MAMSARCGTARLLFRALIAATALATMPLAAVHAQDYMGMAQLYGQGVVNSYGTQLRNSAIRSSTEAARGSRAPAAAVASSWPVHVSSRNVQTHVFTVRELGAMAAADRARAQRLLQGRTIAVQGTVQLPERRANDSFSLVADGGGLRVHVAWQARVQGPRPVRDGDRVLVRGVAELKRQSSLSLSPLSVEPATGARDSARWVSRELPRSSRALADPAVLRFAAAPRAQQEVRTHMAKALAPALKQGVSESQLHGLMATGELQQGFVTGLQRYGLSGDNLADVYGGALVLAWQVARGVPTLSREQSQGVTLLGEQLRATMADLPAVAAMSNHEKQAAAEFLMLGSAVIASVYRHGLETDDRNKTDSARSDAHRFLQAVAQIDSRRVHLSAEGLR